MIIKCRLPKQYEGLSTISQPHVARDKFTMSIREWAAEVGLPIKVQQIYWDYPVRTMWMVVNIGEKDLPIFALKWGLEYCEYDEEVDRHDTC